MGGGGAGTEQLDPAGRGEGRRRRQMGGGKGGGGREEEGRGGDGREQPELAEEGGDGMKGGRRRWRGGAAGGICVWLCLAFLERGKNGWLPDYCRRAAHLVCSFCLLLLDSALHAIDLTGTSQKQEASSGRQKAGRSGAGLLAMEADIQF
jgi:hypothetical protein